MKLLIFAILATLGLSATTANAAYNATAAGTVTFIQTDGVVQGYNSETVTFQLSPMPASVPGATYQYFTISPNSVPDAQTRKNMVALLMLAKMTGGTLQVAYDNLGGFLDQKMIGVYYLTLR